MSTKTKAEELLEIAEKQAGTEAMQMLTDKHLDNVMALREQISIEDIDLVSSSISNNKRIDLAVKERIVSLHSKMAALVQEVANRIETEKYLTAEQAIEGMRLSMVQREKVSALVAADKQLHVSCQSLKVAVEVFCDLNKQIVSRLESDRSIDAGEERKLLLGNALLVFELTDFSIRFIESFKLQGVQEIESIHRDMQKTISALREEQTALRKQAEGTDIDAFLRDQVKKDIQLREDSIVIIDKEWESYMMTVRSMEGEIGSVSKKLPSLKLIRDNAKAQINTLAAVAVIQIVQSNIRAIEGAVLQLEQLQLASLSADRVKRLLGI